MSIIEFENISGNKARIKSDSLSIIRDRLSVRNKNARFIKKNNPFFPDRSFCITKAGKFEIGMFYNIVTAIKDMNLLTNVKLTNEFANKLVPRFKLPDNYMLGKLSIEPYDYQITSVKRMIEFGRGTTLIGTGGGKTLIMALFLATIFKYLNTKRTLIIVPTLQLVEQTYKDFINYGFSESDVSKWSGDNVFQNTNIIVAGLDILQSSNSDLSFLKDIEILMVDEVHVLKKENQINEIIDMISTDNRYGFTGTLPEEIQDQWNIIGKIGKVIFEKSSEELRQGEYISQVKVNIIKILYNIETNLNFMDALKKVDKHEKYKAELEFCINCQFRNEVIGLLAKTTKNNTLVMVDRIAHGEKLRQLISSISDKQVFFIQGSVEIDDREIIRNIMEKHSDVICIAMSSIFSTGINIKNIHNIIFCTAGKAKVKLIQSIGRGLRLHKDKDKLIVYDIADNFKYAQKHFRHRIELYTTEKIPYEITEITEIKEKNDTKESKSTETDSTRQIKKSDED